jgi:signal transduction histidine kinase
MTLRGQLYILALGAVLPVALLAVASGILLVQHERARMGQEAVGRVRTGLAAVDAELAGHISAMRALATSRHLEKGDIEGFHAESVRVLQSQPHWGNVRLYSVEGLKTLSNAASPFDAPAPPIAEPGSLERAIETAQPAIGDVALGGASRIPAVRLRVPVSIDGVQRYIVSVPLRLERFQQLLQEQRLPHDQVIALADRNHRFIARIPALPPGDPVSPSFKAAIERAPQGFFRGETVEQFQTYTPYATSPFSGWALGIAIPSVVVEAGARRAGFMIGVGSLIAFVAAFGLAWLISRRIEKPISALARSAEAIREGRAVEIPDDGRIAQIDSLAKALREASEAARERERALREADRAKDEFIAMLSHELRNPLAALSSAAEVLRIAAPQSEAASNAGGVVRRQTAHMTRLIEDLLDVSRVAMGKAPLQREPLNLAEPVESAVRAMRTASRLEEHEVILRLEPAWADVDRARIVQIVTNLLDNAVKHTPLGKRIEVRTLCAGDKAEIVVRDEGEGIRAEALGRIFDLFAQEAQGLDRRKGGLGIGLSLVKRLAEQHQGEASAESEGLGRGATFTVSLPAIEPAAAAKPPQAEQHRDRQRSRRILLVEDNDDVRETMRAVLTLQGHEVHQARDGNQALGLAGRACPDVAVIDIGLPGIDGFEVAQRLRASHGEERIKLIALTGYAQPHDQQRAREAGFAAHLVKPVSAQGIIEAMARLS